ncbi:MAG: DUF6036 family nucleotidyltransferase [Burkholderiales bacterium]
MNFQQLDYLLGQIARQNRVNGFVVIGSLSVLGLAQKHDIPAEMLLSNEVDAWVENDPERAFEFNRDWGQGSPFEREHGYYFDAVSPKLPTLPDGWEARMVSMQLPAGAIVKFLDPNDAAVSKYARSDPKDRAWIREGLRLSLLSIATIEYRFRETAFLDSEEQARAKSALEEDRQWITTIHQHK